jgi:CheY-like chemotaxis protein
MSSPIKHIMIIDDEDDYHLITKLTLKKAGFEGALTGFHDAEDALRHLRSSGEKPDLLLVDINMPGTTGFEFIEHCEREALLTGVVTTVIMCSSSNRPLDMHAADRYASVHGYMEKAINPEKFERIKHTHCSRPRP